MQWAVDDWYSGWTADIYCEWNIICIFNINVLFFLMLVFNLEIIKLILVATLGEQ